MTCTKVIENKTLEKVPVEVWPGFTITLPSMSRARIMENNVVYIENIGLQPAAVELGSSGTIMR